MVPDPRHAHGLALARLRPAITSGVLALGLLLAACPPRLRNGQFECTPAVAGSCPDGWICLAQGVEHRCFREVQADCGNGIIEAGEQCDGTVIPENACAALGYAGGTPACLSFCVLVCAGCGNGVLNPGEACDEGARNSDLPDAACRTDCQERRCGDGVRDTDEACDEGEDNAEAPGAPCRTDCRERRCGDGVVDPGEACDDGRNANGNGCSESCRLEEGFTCLGEAPSVCFPGVLARLPAGDFVMGSAAEEAGRRPNEHQRPVTLTRDFEIQTTEVTQRQFEIVMGYAPSQTVDCPSCPVVPITWHEATAFTNALSDLAGQDRCYLCSGEAQDVTCTLGPHETPYHCPGFRLPTEAEWEYAARAGTTGATYNGDLIQLECESPNPVLDPIAWFCGNYTDDVSPVALKLPNSWGLFDLLGSAFEWVHDWERRSWDPVPTGAEVDPWGIPNGYYRVLKGGCTYCYAWATRAALREPQPPRTGNYSTGFRPVRSAP